MHESFLKNPFVFAAVTCVLCSFVLSLCAAGLRESQDRNAKTYVHRRILASVGIPGENETRLPDSEVEKLFGEKLRFIAVDAEGNVDEAVTPEQIAEGKVTDRYPLYIMEGNGQIQAYVLPMTGQGLWGPISGYVALEPDGKTIHGVTFDTKAETPGLGAEIAKPQFQEQFVGKHILDDNGQLVSIQVVKGKAEELAPERADHAVDGVSGATITSNGVTEMFSKWLTLFNPYFEKVRQN